MPELPEVETIARYLRQGRDGMPAILGCTVAEAVVYWERSVAVPAVDRFQAQINGQEIKEVGRRGKFLVLELTADHLLVHLRMSGDIFVRPPGHEVEKHDRVVFVLDGGWQIIFNDPRKFGRVWLVADPETVYGDLGPEPLGPGIEPAEFHARLAKRQRMLKPLLMDQRFLAGMGNIYTDEALHLARIHPRMRSDLLTVAETERLLTSIRQVLQAGIDRHGTSIDWVYRGGDYQRYLRVYGRAGKPCPVCSEPIQRVIIGQRSTHICRRCQPYSPAGSEPDAGE